MMKSVERALSNASRTAPKYWPASISTAARPARSRRQALWPGLIRAKGLGLTMPGLDTSVSSPGIVSPSTYVT